MNVLTKQGHQVIYQGAVPAFVAVPYDEYLHLIHDDSEEPTIPHEVVKLHVLEGHTLIKAWRKHLGLTQKEVADKLGISQPGYQQIESSDNPQRETNEKVAAVLGIDVLQLEID